MPAKKPRADELEPIAVFRGKSARIRGHVI